METQSSFVANSVIFIIWTNKLSHRYQQCKVGDQLSVCVGGDFFYHPPVASSPLDLLLVAGGVGINPLFSMLQHHASLLQSAKGKEKRGGAVRLLYSAKSSDELIFKVFKISTQCNSFVS